MRYTITVHCLSIETYTVDADSEVNAILAYENGECTLDSDEPVSREIVQVIAQTGP